MAVIDDATCEQRLWDVHDTEEQNFYLLEMGREQTIDATFKGNWSRFINHSCQPNCEIKKWLGSATRKGWEKGGGKGGGEG